MTTLEARHDDTECGALELSFFIPTKPNGYNTTNQNINSDMSKHARTINQRNEMKKQGKAVQSSA